MNQLESQHQQALFQWIRTQEKKHPMLKWCHAIPNGGSRNIKEAAKLKREGVRSGILDICLPYPSKGFHSLWIEMKYGKNKLSDNQKEFKEYLDANNYKTAVCYSWIEAKEVIQEYL